MVVGEHHGRDVQAGIEGGTGRIGYRHVALGRHGRARRRVGGAAFLRRRGFFSDSVLGDFTKLSWGKGVIVKIIVTDFYSYVQRQMVYV